MKVTNSLTINLLPENKNKEALNFNNQQVNKFKYLLDQNINLNQEYMKTVDKKLMDVCIEMESIFVSRMLKEMRNALPKEKLIDGGYAEKIFEDMLYDDYALNLSKSSNLGLGKMLYDELSRIYKLYTILIESF